MHLRHFLAAWDLWPHVSYWKATYRILAKSLLSSTVYLTALECSREQIIVLMASLVNLPIKKEKQERRWKIHR